LNDLINKLEDWASKRDDANLRLKSLIQGIDMIRDTGVLVGPEKHQLNVIQVQINSLIRYFDERSEKSKEEFNG